MKYISQSMATFYLQMALSNAELMVDLLEYDGQSTALTIARQNVESIKRYIASVKDDSYECVPVLKLPEVSV